MTSQFAGPDRASDEAMWQEAKRLEHARQFERALEAYSELAKSDPVNGDFGCAKMLIALDRHAEARTFLNRVLEATGRHRNAVLHMGIVEEHASQFAAAERLYREAAGKGHPDAERALLRISGGLGTSAEQESSGGYRSSAPANNGINTGLPLSKLLQNSSASEIDLTLFPGKVIDSVTRNLSSFVVRLPAGAVVGVAAVIALVTGGGDPGIVRPVAILGLAAAACLIGYAVFGASTFRYVLYEYRIDIETGVLFRRRRSIWFYRLLEVDYIETPLLSAVGTARLEITSETRPPVKFAGTGPASSMAVLADHLRAQGVLQRRDLKMSFV